ncbi:MAG: hypothetical protein OEW35_19840, partial [Gammaproteobacteria bacterium]|nr:hypothetical protein [Gammaproteobacteria bacterium]
LSSVVIVVPVERGPACNSDQGGPSVKAFSACVKNMRAMAGLAKSMSAPPPLMSPDARTCGPLRRIRRP